MKLTKEDFNYIYILTLFISGIILAVLGATSYKSDLMMYIGLGLLIGSITISVFEVLFRRR